ncbi:ComF family protein [Leifsonia shinshuensis]|uniref:Putative amidophosphoribosyltransferase n=1 Tax=Leifsonia shinshuensis TaxID=150026 RepID=A0A853CVA1_9MICO|nr:phosphoribosyltransferase family protein [Leifsonia shinshuensis]NYJ25026.1 putative amidophosphoribosyltransferase [Leifsonia shinshuensis]
MTISDTRSRPSPLPLLRDAVLDAAAVLLPVSCAGCSAPDRSLCADCTRALTQDLRSRTVQGVTVWSSLDYADVPRAVLLAYKDAGRVDTTRALARSLRPALAAAHDGGPPGHGVPSVPVLIPSTRAAWRKRGYHPTGAVLARTRVLPPPLWRALRLTRQTADQAGLGSAARAGNRAGSMVASRRLRGRRCVIVDDIVTSGATIAEAARAITAAGGSVAGAATIARTPLRRR